ncbi:hypothetical protein [Gloeobacter kilaueensis]|uniref:Uncharacterized protein n=1 Tax=Gloeobacter kilaueensis (strain ATCC BAA-2537 / CCAP 1431/1 / ULC 316 / JS1) TaxID=1183438 RepID=U5QJ20_GLOK1|nr:hypothetical protein [Gloeobacter kilaueensis]AGY58906.1 hypothetical protein GKIL_2660 [Gloeobacter kilaueensis JS1]
MQEPEGQADFSSDASGGDSPGASSYQNTTQSQRASSPSQGASQPQKGALEPSGGTSDNSQSSVGSIIISNSGTGDITSIPYQSISSEPFDIQQSQEKTRSTIAIWLLVLLTSSIICSFAYAIFGDLSKGGVKEFLTLLLSSQFTLVGTALGFYFGTKPRS